MITSSWTHRLIPLYTLEVYTSLSTIPRKLIWISSNHATVDRGSEGSGYCIVNARAKATCCIAIWCAYFHHRASYLSSERYWKGCRPSARNDPLHHWKLSGTMCRQPSHTMRATWTSEMKSNVKSTSSQTKLAQSVSHSFWVNVAIMIAYVVKAVSVAVTWRLRRWARWIALSWRGVVTRGPWSQTISNDAMETGLFHRWVAVHSFTSGRSTSCIPTLLGMLRRRLRSREG
jgi:hypothetical protein